MCEAPAKKRDQVPAELLQPISLKLRTRLLLLVPGGPNQKQNCKSSKMMSPIDLKDSGSMQLSMLTRDMIGSSTKPVAY
jgi:hypothetical protein